MVVKGGATCGVDERLGRSTVGDDHVMRFGLDVVDGEDVTQFRHWHPVNRVAVH